MDRKSYSTAADLAAWAEGASGALEGMTRALGRMRASAGGLRAEADAAMGALGAAFRAVVVLYGAAVSEGVERETAFLSSDERKGAVMDRVAVARKLLGLAKALKADMPMAYLEADDRWKANVSKDLDSVLAGGRGRYEYWSFLTFQEGTSNKFHMFGVLKLADGSYVGGNAYGRIGYGSKVIEVARGDKGSVMSAVLGKERQKAAKGYVKG